MRFMAIGVLVVAIGMVVGGGCKSKKSGGGGTAFNDVYEPNDDSPSAFVLSGSTSLQATIASDIDEDWFAISLNVNDLLTVDLTNLPDDYDLILFDTDGFTLLMWSLNVGTAPDQLRFLANSGGTYFIAVVTGIGGSDTMQPYTLTISVGTGSDDSHEPDNTSAEADAIGDLPGSTNFFGVSWNADFFRINVPSGSEQVDIQLAFTNAAGDLDLFLIDNAGAFLTGSVSVTDDESISFQVPTGGGTFYIVVSPYDTTGNTYALSWMASMP